ncbi:MAG: histidine ammonia-lyase [Paeniclostridium sordellii]|uniref:Histidine ammonia-lyase n=1 Tax=Paeniclostridium hominis TaxID=2764329 RepID=A0ABR7JZY9_9FIRM|nr:MULTISPECIES: histidine ammonia-lyase [Paeniclostridium]MBC6002194.1 histidine ammonia-lyase [Paeniclostridium hominis]MDU1539070.1 histidine ammonia-lyase [Paeniclostridium sordellii]MDU2590990.1 histidine ammonia-lyase [Paeniclostridium sordellii]
MNKIIIDGRDLTIEDVVNVSRNGYKVELSDDVINKVKLSRKLVDKFVDEQKVVYGITTGFGKFSDVVISKEETHKLQRNLIISHACGVGEPLEEDIVRAIMLLRINNLSQGYSGVRVETLNTLLGMLNNDVHPIIPEKGSLGASGDLAPLAHMVLTMIGEGEAIYNGKRMTSKEAMNLAGVDILPELSSKEGLALINGTQVMTAIGALTTYDAMNLLKLADVALSLTMESLNGITCAMDERVHLVRAHRGQINTAKNVLDILSESEMTTKQGDLRVQDAYSLRCSPQIHGASKDAIEYVRNKINIEINSVTDNPIIFPEQEDVISGGNFHGQPMALSFDFLGIALSEIANISERRLERLVNPALSNGLPAFLTKNGGVNSGFMIVQYSAASLVSENKVLAHPASVDSIPSSANQEDHVSMGTIAARKAKEIMENTRNVLAMEILGAVQAIDLRGKKKLGIGTEAAYNIVRSHINFIEEDIVMYKEINKCDEIIKKNLIVEAVEKALQCELLINEETVLIEG